MITIRGSLEPPGLFPRIAPPPVRAPPAGIAENRIAPWQTRTIAAEALREIAGHRGAGALLEVEAAVTATTAGAEAGSAISEAEAAADMEGEAVMAGAGMAGAAGMVGAVMVEDMAGVRPTVAPLTAVRTVVAALTVGVMVVPLMAARLMAGIADTNSHG